MTLPWTFPLNGVTASTVYRYKKENNLRYLFLRSIDGRGGRPCRRPYIPIAVQPTSHDPSSCDPDNYDSASCDPDSCDPASCDPKTCDPKEADSRRQDAKRQVPREARCQEVGAHRSKSTKRRGFQCVCFACEGRITKMIRVHTLKENS